MEQLPLKSMYRVDEVRKYLQVSRSTIYNMIADGRLEAIRIAGRTLRIPRAAVEKTLESTMEE